ncbi:MAG: HAD family hydrolase [Acidobacteriota bacterium]
MRLILFDVDGTLIRCGPQVRPIFAGAMVEVFGTAGDLDHYDFSGKTDQQIVLELLGTAGLPREDVLAALPRMRNRYLEALDERLDRDRMEVLPGIEELLTELAALSSRGDVALGLLTGNWRRGARIKLGRFGLDRHFPFGAFADDAVDRNDLPPIALERASAAMGRRFAPEDALIVGDSARDVECARVHGLQVLAVTTGWTSAERLRRAGADRVVESLAGLAAEIAGGRGPAAAAAG